MKKVKCFVILFFFTFLVVFVTQTGFAQADLWDQQEDTMVGVDKISGVFGEVDDPTDPRDTFIQIVKIVLSFLALVFTLVIMWGGYTWMTSEGNQEKVGVAKKWLTRGIIGIVVILFALLIVTFIFSQTKEVLS